MTEIEKDLVDLAAQQAKNYKIALLNHDLTQVQAAKLIDEGPQQLNRAIKGASDPKSVEIRGKLNQLLEIK
ncbi:transcriptional regulator [Lapidilactobacillus luobeiensis]|uniref:transcriptional regulator n=1 Tax=Lapidilactobacillus luobeiensis TaxID=2950371 RepID=UPI0021C429F9|nr:transcriptional regulator [Lapidilactobacillus luobeiensis]